VGLNSRSKIYSLIQGSFSLPLSLSLSHSHANPLRVWVVQLRNKQEHILYNKNVDSGDIYTTHIYNTMPLFPLVLFPLALVHHAHQHRCSLLQGRCIFSSSSVWLPIPQLPCVWPPSCTLASAKDVVGLLHEKTTSRVDGSVSL
jgi:hypothetical protein